MEEEREDGECADGGGLRVCKGLCPIIVCVSIANTKGFINEVII